MPGMPNSRTTHPTGHGLGQAGRGAPQSVARQAVQVMLVESMVASQAKAEWGEVVEGILGKFCMIAKRIPC